MSPSISVIVTGFNRRAYIESALESIRRQDIATSKIEVIVSTNFADSRVSEICAAEGWTRLVTKETNAGAQTAEAINAAKGSILALLDDDDVWLEGKLRRVETVFGEDSRLEYYNHSQLPIDERGTEIVWKRRRNRRFVSTQGDRSVFSFGSEMATQQFVDRLMRSGVGNNSSTVVSRRLVERFGDLLPGVRSSIDHFLLVAALVSAPEAIVERLPLTKWRVHQENMSNIERVSFDGFLSSIEETARRVGHDNALFLEMARRQGSDGVCLYLAHKVKALNALADMVAMPGWSASSWRPLLRALANWRGPDYRDYWDRALIRILGLSSMSPSIAKAATYLYVHNQFAR